jgi:hypothetical protein
MGKNVPESFEIPLEAWARNHPSDVTRAQLTVMEFFAGNPSAADEMLDELGIRRWFRR